MYRYNPLNSSRLTPLNAVYNSTYGPVDIDYMLRSTGFGLAGIQGRIGQEIAFLEYWAIGSFWIGTRPILGYAFGIDEYKDFSASQLEGPAYIRAPVVASGWLQGSQTLEDIFKSELDQCGYCGKSSK